MKNVKKQQNNRQSNYCEAPISNPEAKNKLYEVSSHLKFVTNITNHIDGEKSVMWRNFRFLCELYVEKFRILHIWSNFTFFHTTDVDIYKISPCVESFQNPAYDRWGEIWNLYAKFMLFYCKIALLSWNCFVVIYALLCGERFFKAHKERLLAPL